MEAVELHDALLKNIEIDIASSAAIFHIEYYIDSNIKNRIPAIITFSGVRSISGLLNLHSINNNSWAGNINYWVRGSVDSPFYFYFVEGCISICAESADIVHENDVASRL